MRIQKYEKTYATRKTTSFYFFINTTSLYLNTIYKGGQFAFKLYLNY